MIQYDRIIIGAGIYGLYAGLYCAKKNSRVLIVEYDDTPFGRASYVNQARVHNGYHYPRSYSTAKKSATYYQRFKDDYPFCINDGFEQIYASSKKFSWTNADEFQKFCHNVDILCEDVAPLRYFKQGMCDGAFLTEECAYDAILLKKHFLHEISQYKNADILCGIRIERIKKEGKSFTVVTNDGEFNSPFVLNATYASINQILSMLGFEAFKIKYELCEIILCEVNDKLKNFGITVMDGPFFSIMPFGKTGLHSLTAVTFTPHRTSYGLLPHFPCQEKAREYCNSLKLGNCSLCPARPETAWNFMSTLARKYLRDSYVFRYHSSLFSIKPILKASELDDSRPTIIRCFSKEPYFYSVLSGKINTVYDLDEIL